MIQICNTWIHLPGILERRGAHLDLLMLFPLKLHMTKDLRFFYKNEENSSVNDEKDNVLWPFISIEKGIRAKLVFHYSKINIQ